MGLSHQKPVQHTPEENKRLLIFIDGFRSSGKTTVLNATKSDKSLPTTPILSTISENIVIDNNSIDAMEYGGRSSDRPLRQIYLQYATGIIFVIDSTDREWTDEVRGALHRMLNARNVQHKSVLILANKQDLPNAMNVDELRDILDLNKLDGNIKWHLQPTSAIYNQGIYEGLKWLADSLKEKTDPIQPIVETINDAKTIKNHFASIFKKNNLKRLFNRFF